MYKDFEELHEHEERSRIQAIENITGISQKYYETLFDACYNIAEFKESLKGILNVKKALSNSPYDKEEINSKDRLDVFFCVDSIRCFYGMGISIDANNKEFWGLLLFYTLVLANKQTNTLVFKKYENIHMLKQLDENLVNYYELLSNSSKKWGQEDKLIVTTILPSDSDLLNQYYALMYRWCLLVSKADKTTTVQEQAWLSKLKGAEESGLLLMANLADTAEEEIKEVSNEGKPLEQLKQMIGLGSVKKEIETLYNFVSIQQQRKKMGMKTSAVSYHCIFTGNAGTGKTTVARIVAQIYKELGILKKGHLVETDRSGLVAEYVGQTAVKTNKIIDSALDGVLFIDEAYALSQGGKEDFGKEAISTLIKRMEDDRNRLVVILAGYDEDMRLFVNSNPGIQSRINRYIHFPDYSEDELFEIFMSLANKSEYHVTPEAQAKLRFIIEEELDKKDSRFGNGRYVRNIFEKTLEHQANRLSLISDITPELLSTITDSDLQPIT
jgi:stage V sporulation protein K